MNPMNMKTNNETGRLYCIIIGAYTIVKGILNMILGGGFGGIIVGIFILAVLFTGLQYMNYLTAAYLGFIVLINLPGNIMHISDNWIYLFEGFIDAGCAALLCLREEIKEHFENKWDELPELFDSMKN